MNLGKRAAKYYDQGARFAKWRAVLHITATAPSQLVTPSYSFEMESHDPPCSTCPNMCNIFESRSAFKSY